MSLLKTDFLLSLKMQHFQRRTFYLSIGDICLGIKSQAVLLEPYHPPEIETFGVSSSFSFSLSIQYIYFLKIVPGDGERSCRINGFNGKAVLPDSSDLFGMKFHIYN